MSQQSSIGQLPKKLPTPSDHGTYWLGKPTSSPGIFKSGRQQGKWFASLGDRQEDFGILCDDNGIRYFSTPKEALDALRADKPLELTFGGSY